MFLIMSVPLYVHSKKMLVKKNTRMYSHRPHPFRQSLPLQNHVPGGINVSKCISYLIAQVHRGMYKYSEIWSVIGRSFHTHTFSIVSINHKDITKCLLGIPSLLQKTLGYWGEISYTPHTCNTLKC